MSVIALDAGHGGRDPGALGRSGTREADVNLAVARLAADALRQAGARVVLTREDARALAPDHLVGEAWTLADLQARCDVANNAQADAFISIHCNAGGGWGTESWVFPDHAPSRALAAQVHPRVVAALAARDRGIKEETFYVLQYTRMPAVLVELGFIDQPQEERLLTDPEAQRRAAAAIAAGALQFVGAAGEPAGTPIMGTAQVGPEVAASILRRHNPQLDAAFADRIAAAYWSIALRYGMRPEVPFSQARKETADFRFGGLVQPWQNNWCGLGATGTPATGQENLGGADPAAVRYQEGVHGAIFATPEIGVEAHVQHLYAYAVTKPLPPGMRLVDPRFALVARGSAPTVEALSGRWAPAADYGQSIVRDYLRPLFAASGETEVAGLRAEIETLRRRVAELEGKVSRAAAALAGEGAQ